MAGDDGRGGPGRWAWILGIAVAGLLVWAVVELVTLEDGAPARTEQPVPAAAVPADEPRGPEAASNLIDRYTRACGPATAVPRSLGRQNRHIMSCTERLTAALDALAGLDTAGAHVVRPQLDDLHAKTGRLLDSHPARASHARRTREVFSRAAELMRALQRSRYPADHELAATIDQVGAAARAIDTKRSLLHQAEPLERFLHTAGRALQRMRRHFRATPAT